MHRLSVDALLCHLEKRLVKVMAQSYLATRSRKATPIPAPDRNLEARSVIENLVAEKITGMPLEIEPEKSAAAIALLKRKRAAIVKKARAARWSRRGTR